MGHFFDHLRTVNRHRRLVRQHCFRCGLYWQGLTHDLSKYSPAEFIPGVKYFQGDKSPNNAQRAAEGYSSAWLHHKGRNKHHYEYWYDVDPVTKKSVTGLGMKPRYIAEMLCDRIAACEVYYGNKYDQTLPWQFFDRTRYYHQMHPSTEKILEESLLLLRDKGEEALYKHIRENILGKK